MVMRAAQVRWRGAAKAACAQSFATFLVLVPLFEQLRQQWQASTGEQQLVDSNCAGLFVRRPWQVHEWHGPQCRNSNAASSAWQHGVQKESCLAQAHYVEAGAQQHDRVEEHVQGKGIGIERCLQEQKAAEATTRSRKEQTLGTPAAPRVLRDPCAKRALNPSFLQAS